MKTVTKAEWIDALKSGKYKQGEGRLRRDDRFCCLGVLCDLMEVPYTLNGDDGAVYDFGNRLSTTMISGSILDQMGVRIKPASLAKMNDSGYQFEGIAKYLDRHC